MRLRSLGLSGAACVLLLVLSGCNDGPVSFAATTGQRVSAPGTALAFFTLDGMPQQLSPKLTSALAGSAAARDMQLVASGPGVRYQLRGYLSAFTTDKGQTEVAWVWDVFDSARQRAQRIAGSEVLSGGGDPWSRVDDALLSRVAERSMNEIAQFLTTGATAETSRPASPAAFATATSLMSYAPR
jgi:hypothetical protein